MILKGKGSHETYIQQDIISKKKMEAQSSLKIRLDNSHHIRK